MVEGAEQGLFDFDEQHMWPTPSALDGDDPKSKTNALIMGRRGSVTSKRTIQGP
eukprot:SAG25_NODE_862_length_5023_cov_2.854010_2_plen_54_part_00